jgi:uncharacterized membrane protein
METLVTLIPLAALLIAVDVPWLYINQKWSQKVLEKVQGGAPLRVRWQGVPIVYLALAILIQKAKSTAEAGIIGACTYAVYDFTNYSTLANYELELAIADTLWGGTLFMIVRTLGIYFRLL